MEWISVKERLPENANDVLAIMQDNTIFMGRFSGKSYWKFYFSDNGLQYDKARERQITHWMPLPDPPKEDESNTISR